jgi:hypothetical protein
VHVYRYGPSVVESMLLKARDKAPVSGDHRPNEKADEYRLECARYWNACIVEVDRASKALGLAEKGSFFELSYEELCNAPGETLNKLTGYLGVSPDRFGFDLSTIKSTNYKVKNYLNSPDWAPLLDVMQPGLALKGYTV